MFSNSKSIVEAFQWGGELVSGFIRKEIRTALGEHPTYRDVVPYVTTYHLLVPHSINRLFATVGDWICKNTEGEFLVYDDSTFQKSFTLSNIG
jgi:hypothetical protein